MTGGGATESERTVYQALSIPKDIYGIAIGFAPVSRERIYFPDFLKKREFLFLQRVAAGCYPPSGRVEPKVRGGLTQVDDSLNDADYDYTVDALGRVTSVLE